MKCLMLLGDPLNLPSLNEKHKAESKSAGGSADRALFFYVFITESYNFLVTDNSHISKWI